MAQGWKLNYSLTSDFAIAADINPGPPGLLAVTPTSPRVQMAQANSRNHNGDGQNVLYAVGHVEFQNTPFCGMARPGATTTAQGFRDHIYTSSKTNTGSTGSGNPIDQLDSILLPTDDVGGKL